jgi:hypothetical protein
LKLFATSFNIENEQEVTGQDIIDAIDTLKFDAKLDVHVPPPGKGPQFFLDWAKDELEEAALSQDKQTRYRKFYNASVYSKGAVECLVDWFLSRYLLQYTISPVAGIAQKLEALDSENLLGISFSLFNDLVFEPRNRGIHRFELVEEQEAKHGFELAKLTIKNCVNTVNPSNAAVFYGTLETYRGKEALEKVGHPSDKEIDAFYFAGIGQAGSHGVVIDRDYDGGKIAILSTISTGEVEARTCRIRGNLTAAQLRAIFARLENDSPATIGDFNADDIQHVLDSLIPRRKEGFAGKQRGPKRPR